MAKSPEYGQYLRNAAEAQQAAEEAQRDGDDPAFIAELLQRAAYFRALAREESKSGL